MKLWKILVICAAVIMLIWAFAPSDVSAATYNERQAGWACPNCHANIQDTDAMQAQIDRLQAQVNALQSAGGPIVQQPDGTGALQLRLANLEARVGVLEKTVEVLQSAILKALAGLQQAIMQLIARR